MLELMFDMGRHLRLIKNSGYPAVTKFLIPDFETPIYFIYFILKLCYYGEGFKGRITLPRQQI